MITVNNLKKAYGTTTACNIEQLTVNDGELIGIVGNNGAGKTTLFRLMLDLIKPDDGNVDIDGIDPAKSEDWKSNVGAYIDEGFLIEFLTPKEYFAFIAKIADIDEQTLNERLDEMHEFLGSELTDSEKLIRNLSAGNKQKVGIASAMLRQPKLLILDEPFNYLDPSSQILLRQTLKDYNTRHQATILVSSHNLQHTLNISSRMILLENGQIIDDLDCNTDNNVQQKLEQYFNFHTHDKEDENKNE